MKTRIPLLSAIGAAILLASVGTSAVAQARGDFNAYDKDGNGAISQQEFDAMRAQRPGTGRNAPSFADLDRDGNGSISRAEFRKAHEYRMRGDDDKGRDQKRPGFADIDSNHDGFITQAELDQYKQQQRSAKIGRYFEKLDANGDGKIDKSEFAKYREHDQQRRAAFADIDSNRDNSISQAELEQFSQKQREQRVADSGQSRKDAQTRHFEKMDLNGDGKIDKNEFAKYSNRKQRDSDDR